MQSDPTTRNHVAVYAQRMNTVLDAIDQHLDTPLELATLAEAAHFSAFHFHRVFAAWMGETLGDYVRRRRLEVAAVHLAGNPAVSVLQVALAVGFGSGEAFARAFKLRFGCTPSAWRANTPQRWAQELQRRRVDSNLDQVQRNPDQADGVADQEDQGLRNPTYVSDMQVKIVNLPAARVAYMRHIGPYGASVNRFWKESFFPWRAANGLDQAACYGIGHDDPNVTKAAQCRYDACVEVPESFVAKSPASIAVLPGGRYAVADFRGTVADVSVAWTTLLRDWLPASGMQADGRPCFEYYPTDAFFDAASGVFGCQICMPVRAF